MRQRKRHGLGDFTPDIEVSPKANLSRLSSRQRCTVAHEIGHTLFYDVNAMPPQVLEGSPRSAQLEHFCHLAGRHILIPEFPLDSQLRQAQAMSGQLVLELADKFAVSPEVALRRLADAPACRSLPTALFLAEYTPAYDDTVIRASFSGLPLLTVKTPPALFSNLKRWVGRWAKPEFWNLGDYTDAIEARPHTIRLTKTMLPQDLSRFFLQIELSLE